MLIPNFYDHMHVGCYRVNLFPKTIFRATLKGQLRFFVTETMIYSQLNYLGGTMNMLQLFFQLTLTGSFIGNINKKNLGG
jgi:hypothetical protein